jgi:hypothetical protein
LGERGTVELLTRAGQARLAEKALRISLLIKEQGEEQTLYQLILESLGYAAYKAPFTLLAARVPWELLRTMARGYKEGRRSAVVEAALLGAGGLIPRKQEAHWEQETIRYWQSVNALWKALESQYGVHSVDGTEWVSAGSRPANTPYRRISGVSRMLSKAMACSLADLFLTWTDPINFTALAECVSGTDREGRGYWLRRCTWCGKRLARPIALIGRNRAMTIIANVILPFLCCRGEPSAGAILRNLPAADDNSIVKLAFTRLFGKVNRFPSSWGMAAQQGLIHIYRNCCAVDKTACRACDFRAIVERMVSPTSITAR